MLAVDKPAGVSVQATKSQVATLEDEVRRHLVPTAPESAYLGTVHRLDRPVSGVLVFAKTPKAARRLASQFAQRQVLKEYWSVVEQLPDPPSGLWEDWLLADRATGIKRAQRVAAGTPQARPARTRYLVAEPRRVPEGCAWLRLFPETGRMHQLRVQAASRGCPILGDRTYGASRAFAPEAIALHARRVEFQHPTTGERLVLEASPPTDWLEQGIELAL